jgi:hypothetical protein
MSSSDSEVSAGAQTRSVKRSKKVLLQECQEQHVDTSDSDGSKSAPSDDDDDFVRARCPKLLCTLVVTGILFWVSSASVCVCPAHKHCVGPKHICRHTSALACDNSS